jgi:hypothetical protein
MSDGNEIKKFKKKNFWPITSMSAFLFECIQNNPLSR